MWRGRSARASSAPSGFRRGHRYTVRVSSSCVISRSVPCPITSWCSQYRQAVLAVSSAAWMLPSTQRAGLSAWLPVAVFVSTSSQISLPSKLLPIDCSSTSLGAACS